MPPFEPLKAIGLVMNLRSDNTTAFLGSCFAFRQPHTFLTAAHCIGELQAAELGVGLPYISLQTVLPVETAARHPEADLALLTVDREDASDVEPFRDFVANFTLGEDFFAFGYPEDVFGPAAGHPTPRLFKGYYQRYMYYQSPLGYAYQAGEMSIPAPAGLSGGAVFRPGALPMLTGLVTENLESTTVLEAVEEIQRDAIVERSMYQKIINYGVSLLLNAHDDWYLANGATARKR